jgi:predicted methyltransferase
MMRTLANLKSGEQVAVILLDTPVGNGIGYYAHAFSKAVGPTGHVYDITRTEMAGNSASATIGGRIVTGDYADVNVTKVTMPLANLARLPKLDLVWAAAGSYSFFSFLPPIEPQTFKPVFDALKPGGLFILMDADVELDCYRPQPNCRYARPRLLASLPRDRVAEMIEQAGFMRVMDTSNFKDPSYVRRGVVLGWGSDEGTYAVGFPFIWKFQRQRQ